MISYCGIDHFRVSSIYQVIVGDRISWSCPYFKGSSISPICNNNSNKTSFVSFVQRGGFGRGRAEQSGF